MDEAKIILSVSELNAHARALLEQSFNQVWITGEISNFSQPSSGHCYFTLKDANAQVRCAIFRTQHQKLKFKLENGLQILLRGQVSLYEARGDYQLIVSYAEASGNGLLQRAFEVLKQKLEAEGLFLALHKKPLPEFPKQIGVITSATGAAIRDILHVLKRRFANIPVIIYPSQVQGERAASQLIEAIQIANKRQECDVLILARGGGSLEDLWPFNEEKVAYAIFNSVIPIVTGIGHEVDFTIADFVADQRAPTPSAAAELVSPKQEELAGALQQYAKRLLHLIQANIQKAHLELMSISKAIQHPGQRLQAQSQRLDLLEQNLILAQLNLIKQKQAELTNLNSKLNLLNPKILIKNLNRDLANLGQRITLQTHYALNQAQQQLSSLSQKLDAFSPLRTLERGYAILTRAENHSIIRDASELKEGDLVMAQLAKGKITATIKGVKS